jgi:Putative rhamnosyl transferase
MRILGFCRFSYFGTSDTGRAIQTEEDAMRVLYAPDRMAARFHLFEHLTAPSIKHQTDKGFRFIVVTSDILPEPYMTRLQRIVDAVPQMELLVTANRELAKVLSPVIRAEAQAGVGPTLNFRLDDDDAVAIDHVARLRAVASQMTPPTLICFPKGFLLFSDGESKFGHYYKEFHAQGLARLNAADDSRDPFRIQHRQEAHRTPSYMDPRPYAYIYGTHPFNNTKVGGPDAGLIARYLRNYPEIADITSTPECDAALAIGFPFLTPERLRAIHASMTSALFNRDAPLNKSLL